MSVPIVLQLVDKLEEINKTKCVLFSKTNISGQNVHMNESPSLNSGGGGWTVAKHQNGWR